MEKWEALCPGGLQFYCGDGAYKPGTDSFLLGAFPRLKPGARVCDLGSGAGLLGLLLLQRERTLTVTGVERLETAAEKSAEAAALNGLGDRLSTVRGDIREIPSLLAAGGFDLCISNPPYFQPESGCAAPESGRRAARTEETCTLDALCRAAAYLLRWGGAFCLSYRPERLCDLFCTLRENGLEPKRLCAVAARAALPPSLVLVEARRGGRPGLAVEPVLLLQGEDGGATAAYNAAYFRAKERL